jgi:hypothetical protein
MSKRRTNYMKRADVLFGQKVRARGVCESDRPNHSGNLQCAHIISRSYKSIRTNELNALCLCQGHHLYYTHHPLEWRQWIEAQHPGRWDELTAEALRYERVDWKSEVARLSVPLSILGEQ